MKKILLLLIVTAFTMPAVALETTKKPATAKSAPVKKEVKKHKKFEGTKVPEKAPAKPKTPAKK